jgi:hypothetical protein
MAGTVRYNVLAVTGGARTISTQVDATPGQDFVNVIAAVVSRWQANSQNRGIVRVFVNAADSFHEFPEELAFRRGKLVHVQAREVRS